MAAKGRSSAEKFSRWGITASNLRKHLEEMPHVAADLAEMDRLIAEARALESQQEAIRGTAREVTARPRRTPRRKPGTDAPETKPGTPAPAPVQSNP